MQYFVVMIDYGRRGREAIVDPEITRREVVSRVASGEYNNISFIHEIANSSVDDITAEILAEAAVPEMPMADAIRGPAVSITRTTSGSTIRFERRQRPGRDRRGKPVRHPREFDVTAKPHASRIVRPFLLRSQELIRLIARAR